MKFAATMMNMMMPMCMCNMSMFRLSLIRI